MKNKNFYKTLAIITMILLLASSMWFAVPATFCYAQGGYDQPAGGGGGGLPEGYTSFSDIITIGGRITIDSTAESSDGLCTLIIKRDTIAQTSAGNPLYSILMVESQTPPTPPPDSNIIGLVYDFGPAGATFNPPITVTFEYDPANLPAGVDEENLTLAYYNATTSDWVVLEGIVVDADTNTISGLISHFTAFAVIASTKPAEFTASNLTVMPKEVEPGQSSTIRVTITNTGDLPGTFDVTLQINGTVTESKSVTLNGGDSRKVSFLISQANTGTYDVNINGVPGILIVKAPPPEPEPTPPAPAPEPTPPAPKPEPTPPAPKPEPTPPVPEPAPEPEEGINWWLIGGIIAAVIIIAIVGWVLLTFRRG